MKTKQLMIGIAVIAVVLAMGFGTRNFFSPPDLVELHLEQVPDGIDRIYVLSRDGGEIAPLNWYDQVVIVEAIDPRRIGEQWYRIGGKDRRVGYVQWKTTDAYGILAQRRSGGWAILWLEPGDIDGPSPWRYLTGGGQKVTIRIPDFGRAKEAPKSLTDQFTRR